MKQLQHAIELGATMYIPATHEQLWEVTEGHKFPALKSVAVCLEDAVLEKDVQTAMVNLKHLLQRRADAPNLKSPAVFVRPRNIEMAKHIADWDLNRSFSGMILPKFTLHNLMQWMDVLPPHMNLMPTLETREIFDMGHNIELNQALKYDFHKTLCLRIGGNDLLSCLHLRRPKNSTIYQTPIGMLISQLSGDRRLFEADGDDELIRHDDGQRQSVVAVLAAEDRHIRQDHDRVLLDVRM